MKVAIDARAYSWAGVGRYIRNLLSGLARIDDGTRYVVLLGERDVEAFDKLKAELNSDRFEFSVVEGSYYSWREQLLLPWQLVSVAADLWHFTHFNVPVLFNKPYVVTVHDVTRFIFPGQTQQGLGKQIMYEHVFRSAVERARAVISVSDATLQELGTLPLKLPAQVRTIHEGVDERFMKPVSDKARQRVRMSVGTQGPYLLYVGVWMGHKNLSRLLQAFVEVRQRHPEMLLVLTGRPRPGYVPVDQLVHKLGLPAESVVFLGQVADVLLPALYAEATCLLYPSLYEGFGLPALEAAAMGTPVLAANVVSMPEILGEAACYVNPEDVLGMVNGIEKILNDAGYRDRLVAEGLARVQDYSWDRCAGETLDVYKEAR